MAINLIDNLPYIPIISYNYNPLHPINPEGVRESIMTSPRGSPRLRRVHLATPPGQPLGKSLATTSPEGEAEASAAKAPGT